MKLYKVFCREATSDPWTRNGHYLLVVKKNQKELFEDISCAFAANKPLSIEENWEYDHGRFEIRKYNISLAQSTMDEEIVTG